VAEKLDYQPGAFTVERHVRGKWVCRQCDRLVQAAVPAHVIDKGTGEQAARVRHFLCGTAPAVAASLDDLAEAGREMKRLEVERREASHVRLVVLRCRPQTERRRGDLRPAQLLRGAP
jgi:hypothetical protein